MGSCTRESVPLYGPHLPGLCISVYVCTVRTPKGFIQCAGARPPGLFTSMYFSTVRAQTGVVRYKPGFVLLCTERAPRALCGASLQRLCVVCARACDSMYCTSPKSFVRCEPTKALYSVRQGLCLCVLYEPQELRTVRAYKGFTQCAPGLVLLCTVRAPRAVCGASLQRLYAVCWCSPPALCTECLCARGVE